MIKYLLVLVCFLQLTAQGQPAKPPVKGQLASVKDWGSRSLYIISDAFFNDTRGAIIGQIGEEEFAEVEKHCKVAGWPDGLYVSDLSEEQDKAFDIKLNRLKMYKIASYEHIFNGKKFDRYVILRVPFAENKAWDSGVKWEGNVYFLIKENDVTVL